LLIKKTRDTFTDSFQKMYDKYNLDGTIPVRNITFCITEDCQLRCSYCYLQHKNCVNKMNKEVAKKAVDMLFEEYYGEGEYINPSNSEAIILEFIGGEPLLELEIIEYIVDYFRYKAISHNHKWALNHIINLTTNGVRFCDDDVQRFFKKYKGRISLTVSIDGNKDLHDACRVFPSGEGSYEFAERAIKKQLELFGVAETKLTLAPPNIQYFSESVKHLYNLGLTEIFANCVYEEGWTTEHAKILYQEMKNITDYFLEEERYKTISCSIFDDLIGFPMDESENANYCGGTGKMMAISTDGKVYPCLRYLPFSLPKEVKPIVIGDVENGISNTQEQCNTISCLQCITRRSQSTDECFNCPIAKGCSWCSAYNHQVFGTPDKRATYICIMHKSRVLGSAYFYNRLYRKLGLTDRFKLHIPKEWALEIISEEEFKMLQELSE
jgi:uncharacterized protein